MLQTHAWNQFSLAESLVATILVSAYCAGVFSGHLHIWKSLLFVSLLTMIIGVELFAIGYFLWRALRRRRSLLEKMQLTFDWKLAILLFAALNTVILCWANMRQIADNSDGIFLPVLWLPLVPGAYLAFRITAAASWPASPASKAG